MSFPHNVCFYILNIIQCLIMFLYLTTPTIRNDDIHLSEKSNPLTPCIPFITCIPIILPNQVMLLIT